MLVQQVERLQMFLSNQEIEQVMETPSNDSHLTRKYELIKR